MEALFHQPPHPEHLALCSPPSFHVAFPHLGKSVHPGNTLSWDMEYISLCVSPATCAQYFISATLHNSFE